MPYTITPGWAQSWTGNTSNDWFDKTNWSTGAVPTASDDVTVETPSTDAVIVSDQATNGIAAARDLTIGNTGFGSLTIEKGGHLKVSDTVSMGLRDGNGTISVSGSVTDGGTMHNSTLAVGEELLIGAGGAGALIVSEGGEVIVNGFGNIVMGQLGKFDATMVIGNIANEAATSPGTVMATSITGTNVATLLFNHTATVSDQYEFGVPIRNADIVIKSGYSLFSGDNSELLGTVMIDGGSMAVNNALGGSEINDGAGGTGILLVASGAEVTANGGNGTITIARESGSTGRVIIGAASGEAAAGPGILSGSVVFGAGTGTLLFNHTGTSSDPLEFQSAISGNGAVKVESGFTRLSGDNRGFTGTIAIDGGTLAATGDLVGSTLNVGDSGTGANMIVTEGAVVQIVGETTVGVESGSYGTMTVSGAASDGTETDASTLEASGGLVVGSAGAGTLIVNNAGAVAVRGAVTVAEKAGSTGVLVIGSQSGDAALGTGRLAASSVAFGSGRGSILFNHADDSGGFEFSLPFTGNGTINAESGYTVLSANNSGFTGSTVIDGGTLAVTGTLPGAIAISNGGTLDATGALSGPITVGSGGMLRGTGLLSGAVTVSSGGTIAPGGPVGTLRTADVTIESGGTFDVEIDSDGNADLIDSSGTVTLDGGTVVVGSDSYYVDSTFTIVTADTRVIGKFADLSGATAFIDQKLTYDDNNVYLTQSVSRTFGSVGITENHRSVALALDSLETDHEVVQAVYGTTSHTEARQAYDALSGEIHATAKGALMNNGRDVSDAVERRLHGMFSDRMQETDPARKGEKADPANRFWISAHGGWNHIDATANTAAADNNHGGVIAGLDGDLGRHWHVGAFGAYGFTDVTQSGRSSRADVDSYTAGVYGAAVRGPFSIGLGGMASRHNIDSARSVVVTGLSETVSADYEAYSWQLFSEARHRTDVNGLQIEPFASLSFMQINTDGFSETGGNAALTASPDTEDTIYTTLGLRLGRNISIRSRLNVMAGWRHAFGDDTPTSSFTLPGSDSFAVAGAPIAEDALIVGLGFNVDMSDRLTAGARYDGQFGDGTTSNLVEGWLRLRF